MSRSDQIRDGQRETWAELSAGWEKWDSIIMEQLGPVGDAIIERLDIDQPIHLVFPGEARDCTRAMLLQPARKVVRHADIQRAVPPARQDVDVVRHDHHVLCSWVPAFAGTTQRLYSAAFSAGFIASHSRSACASRGVTSG